MTIGDRCFVEDAIYIQRLVTIDTGAVAAAMVAGRLYTGSTKVAGGVRRLLRYV